MADRDVFTDGLRGEIVHVIKGKCFGVVLYRPEWSSHTIHFHHIVHDDGNWLLPGGSGSAFWVPDVAEVFRQAEEWLKENTDEDCWGDNKVLYPQAREE